MTAYHTEMISTDQEQNEVVSAVSSITSTVPKQAKLSIRDRLLKSQLISCIAGSIILFGSFGIRQAIGVFLIPITQDTGWDRSTFSSAAGTFQLFWGFSQPFLVYLAERKFGFGKSIFMACLVYGVGLLIVYASRASSALFLVAYGIFVGSASGGNSFPVVLAAIGRRFPQKSNQQAKAFGIVSSFGSLGQCVFLPVSRAMIAALGWRLPFIIFGVFMISSAPLAYFLQRIPPTPALPAAKSEQADLLNEKYNVEDEENNTLPPSKVMTAEAKPTSNKNNDDDNDDDDDFSAPNITTALKEALVSPSFIMATLGFAVCGFHVSFLSTHFPAYLQENGIDPLLGAWTMSILGAGSMIGSMACGYITSYISARIALTLLYLIRVILIAIFVFVPISLSTVLAFSVIFGFTWLPTVPLTTKFIGDVFGYRFIGTLSSVSFTGHQIGAFLGAYVSGVVYDKTNQYLFVWYTSLALAIFAVLANYFAPDDPVNLRRRGIA